MKRREFFGLGFSVAALSMVHGKSDTQSFPVTFTWKFASPMTYEEAVALEAQFVDVPTLVNINEQLFKSGKIRDFSFSFSPSKMEYHYKFDSLATYVEWELELKQKEIIDFKSAKDLYKIENSLLSGPLQILT